MMVMIAGVVCSAYAQTASDAATQAPSSHIRVYKFQPKHGVDKGPVGIRTTPLASSPSGAHLNYYGGRVVANIHAVIVLYGSGSYLSNVSSTGTPSMASFYEQYLSKTTLTTSTGLLQQYNTPATGGTNQIIGPGTFQNLYQITPSSANNGSTIDDSQIQSEITAQINAGHLPAPEVDAQGNPITYYAVFFPNGKTITQGGSSSCVAGGFCAYHGTIPASGSIGELYYGVHPDMQAGSGCDTGCGNASTAFGNYTSVASHEITEVITDAEVGLATTNGPPLAWYDPTNGEIGDICNASQDTFTACDGQTYTYQLEFSNSAPNGNACVSISPSCGSAPNDFSISASPASVSVLAGKSTSSTISTATVSGSAQTVSLSVSGAPSGVTASLSPTSVTSGGSSTLSISTTTSAVAGTYTLTVTGTAASGSHSTTVTLTITSGGGGGGGGGLVNGDFETGDLTGWTASGASETVISAGCHGGTYCAKLGSTSPTNGDSTITQTFTAAANATGISLWYKETCPDTVTYDWAVVTLTDNTTSVTRTLLPKTCSTTPWTNLTASVTAGDSYTLTMTSHDDNYASDPTYTLFDDVTLTTGGGGGGGGGIVNGDFETGDLTGWTASGASETVINTGCHGGTYCAQLGSTSPTNGDSTITQTFTAPGNATAISLWYKMTCPDTVTYDWAIVTLTDNTTSVTTTLLPKTCTTNAWTNLTASVNGGDSYTLTLTSHDDNYSADPSYTLFDDVSVNGNTPANDFSLSASPSSPTFYTGSTGNTVTISTATTSGSAQLVSLSASGAPSGVTISFNPTSVTSGASSTMSIDVGSSVAAGKYTITVTGSAASGSHTTTVALTVALSDFSLSASPTSTTVYTGATGTVGISTATTVGSAQSVSLSASGAPSGVTISFNPTSVTSGNSSTMSIDVGSSAPAGTYTITVTGTAASGSHTTTVTLTVALSDFSLSASPTSTTVYTGSTGTVGISTATTIGSAQSVSLSASGAPSGVTISFNPPSVTSGASSTMSMAVSGNAAVGTSTITVTGTGASGSHTTTVALTIALSDFGLSASPKTITVSAGSSRTTTISTSTTAGPAETISFGASGVPNNVTAGFNPTSVTSGQTSTLTFAVGSNAISSTSTVTVTGTGVSTSHSTGVTLVVIGIGGIVNGGFETGSLYGWVPNGGNVGLTGAAHSGSYAAMLGSANPTNGNNTLSQTFTAPSGTTILSLYYAVGCPANVSNGWVMVTLTDNTVAVSKTIVPKSCPTSFAWTQAVTGIVAGHSYTLTFTNHAQKNAVYSVYDDVMLQ
jgi:hypothetical protein